MSNQETFRSVADRFGLSRGHAHKLFIKICKMLSYNQQQYIVWPTGQQAIKTIEEFNQIHGPNSFPNVFGCVDGTHIAIPGPHHDNSYYNRKGYNSILLQGICNAKQEFINIYCGWPGSTHDARMWQNSQVYLKLNAGEPLIPPNSYLLGDSAYPLRQFIMVPFRDNGHLTESQKKFNQKLSSTRVVIENTFGRLKGLFRRLKYLNIVNLNYAKYIISAACILHNICVKEGNDEIFEEEMMEDHNVDDAAVSIPQSDVIFRNELMRAIIK
ncbi:hypothetical protein RI129_003307 [Pyrocoelia pectoralis]|uniref:DDE Tnp4 domain-containing protein n=1 Tax=Pyrocoelia pectoralis TaxID=417401 RepID=A0AAN7VGQ8_9COLE